MPLSWDKVVAKPEFQALSPSDQIEARFAYFNDVVLPHVPANDRLAAFDQFNGYADSLRPAPEVAEPPPENSDVLRGVKTAAKQIPQLMYGAAAGLGAIGESAFGEGGMASDLKAYGVKKYQEIGADIAKDSKLTDSLTYSWERATKEGDYGAMADWLQYGIGYGGVQALEALASAGIGSMVGKATLKGTVQHLASKMVAKEAARIVGTKEGAALAADQVSKMAVVNVAGKIGQIAGVGVQAFGMEAGEIGGGLAEQSVERGTPLTGAEIAKGLGAVGAAGLLEFAGDKLGVDIMLGKTKLFRPAGAMTGLSGKATRTGLAATAAIPAEAGTEYLQTGWEEYGQGKEANILPFNQSAEAQRHAIDAAGLGGVGGGGMAVVGGVLSKPQEQPAAPTQNLDTTIRSAPPSADPGVDASIDEILNSADTLLNETTQGAPDVSPTAAAATTGLDTVVPQGRDIEPVGSAADAVLRHDPATLRREGAELPGAHGRAVVPGAVAPVVAGTGETIGEQHAIPVGSAAEMGAHQVGTESPGRQAEGQGVGQVQQGVEIAGAQEGVNQPENAIAKALQNRNRDSKASVLQMQAIAAKPNPRLLMASPTMENGAPVVTDLENKGIARHVGNEDVVVTGKREIPFRYAVVEADQLAASNFADGSRNPEYATNTDKLTAITNGRTAGVMEAFNNGTAQQYKDAIAGAESVHGISADAIQGMDKPVLVRLISPEHITETIGDESNTTGTLGLSAVEQARNDANRIDIAALTFNDNGTPTTEAMRGFIQAMPESERQNLAPNGIPTKQAVDRVLGASLYQAYGSEELVELAVQSTEPEARTVIAALSNAAPAMMKLEGAGDLDIRPLIIEAAKAVVNAGRQGVSVTKLASQRDIVHSDGVQIVLDMFARNVRSARRITETLNDAANIAATGAAHKAAGDMFGGESVTRQDVLRRFGDDTTGTQNLGQPGGRGAAQAHVQPRTADQTGRAGHGAAQEVRAANERVSEQTEVTDPSWWDSLTADQRKEAISNAGLKLKVAGWTFISKHNRAAILAAREPLLTSYTNSDIAKREQAAQDTTAEDQAAVDRAVEYSRNQPLSLSAQTQERTEGKTSQAGMFTPDGRATAAAEQTGKAKADADMQAAQEQQATAILDRANVTGKDRLDIMRDFKDGKHSLEDLEKAYPDAGTPPVERGSVGAALTKEQKKSVLKTLVDVYKTKGAEKESKGLDRNGNERMGYAYQPELFEKSDITGAMVRYHVTLPDGRIAHPTELFPEYTQSDIDAEMSRRQNAERNARLDVQRDYARPDVQFDDKATAAKYWDEKSEASKAGSVGGWPTIHPSSERSYLTNGEKFIMVPIGTMKNGDMVEALAAEGWKPPQEPKAEQPSSAAAAPVSEVKRAAEAEAAIEQADAIEPVQSEIAILPVTSVNELQGRGQEAKIGDFGRKVSVRKDESKPTGSRMTKEADDRPAWARPYMVMQVEETAGYLDKPNIGKWQVMKKSAQMKGAVALVSRQFFATEQEALDSIPLVEVARNHKVYSYDAPGTQDAALKSITDKTKQWGIYRLLAEGKKRALVKGGFATYEDAMQHVASKPVEIIEHKFEFPERPWLDKIERTGADRRNGKPVTKQMFIDTFAPGGVVYGNWLLNADETVNDDGQELSNHAYDGLMDLADTLGIPPKALFLNGDMVLGLGADGKGGKTSAAAHYAPDKGLINLTKINGAGSLSHEWWHSVDHYFAKGSGYSGSSMVANNAQYNSKSPMRAELAEAIKHVIKTINYAEKSRTTDANLVRQNAQKRLDDAVKSLDYKLNDLRRTLTAPWKEGKKPATEAQLKQWDALADKLRNGDQGEQIHIDNPSKMRFAMGFNIGTHIRDMNAIYKAVGGSSFLRQDPQSAGRQLIWPVEAIKESKIKLDAKDDETVTYQGRTDFFLEAKEIDGYRASNYWSTPEEMGARAFESYIFDKLTSGKQQSDYLVYGVENRYYAALGMKPYPEGGEREAINAAFDKLFKTVQTKETDKGVAIFNTQPGDAIPESEWLSVGLLEEETSKLLEPFATEIPVLIRDTARDAGIESADDGVTSGAVYNGRIHLFRDGLTDRAAVVRTLWHELLHFGFRRFMTEEQYIAKMGELYMKDGWVRNRANAWMQTAEAKKLAETKKHGYVRARAVDEALADLAEIMQTEPTGYQNNTKLAQAKRTISEWIAKLADFFGFKEAAQAWREYAAQKDARDLIVSTFAKLREGAPPSMLNAKWHYSDPAFMDAWHGSPHDHNKFDMEYVGAGEGNQAYGHGLYFAGSKDVAEWYKTKLSSGSDISTLRATKNGKELAGTDLLNEYFKPGRQVKGYSGTDEVVSFSPQQYGDNYKAWHVTVKTVIDQFGNTPKSWDAKPRTHATSPDAKLVKDVLEADGWAVSKGRLYQVELAPDENEYLLWDKPLSEQSEKVKAALGSAGVDVSEQPDEIKINGKYQKNQVKFGKDLYADISEERDWIDAEASKYLHSIGIRGIKYLDGSSRSKGDGNYNYVIFDDKDVSITAKHSKAQVSSALKPNRSEAESFRASLDSAMSSLKSVVSPITVGSTPAVLQELGASNLPVQVSRDVVRKATNGVRHHVSMDAIRALPEELANPVMVFKSASEENSLVVLTEMMDENGAPVIAAVHLSAKEGRQTVNRIGSIYGKEEIGAIESWINKGYLLYQNQEKSLDWVRRSGLQLPKGGSLSQGSGATVKTEQDIVNGLHSFAGASNATPQTIESVRQATAKLRASWHGFKQVRIVQSVKEIPSELYLRALRAAKPIAQDSEGIYDPKTRTVYLIADNLASPERAVWVAIHEVAGHGGIRMLGSPVVDALNFAAKNGFVAKLAQAIAADRGETFDTRTHTDEAIAELAAATITGNVDAIMERYGVKVPMGMRSNLLGMIKRVVDAVRNFIGRVTGKPVEEVSDGEVLGLIRRMKDAVEGAEQGYDTAGVSNGVMASRAHEWKAIDVISARFKESVNKFLSGDIPADGNILLADNTPASLQLFGWKDSPLAIKAKVIDKLVYDHAVTASMFGQMADMMRRPAMMFSDTKNDSIVIIGELREGRPTLIALRPEVSGSRERTLIVTAYEPNTKWEEVTKRLSRGELIYRDTTKKIPDVVRIALNVAQKKYSRGSETPLSTRGASTGGESAAGSSYKVLYQSDLVKLEQEMWGDTPLFSSAPKQQPIPGTAQPPAQPPRQGNITLQGGQPGNRASWDSPEPSMFDDLVYKLQDKNIDLKRVLQAIRETGAQVAEQWNAYLQEELFHGRAAKRVQDFVNTELKPMMIEMAQRGMKQEELDAYLHARHAKEANALIASRDPNMPDGGSGMTNQEADDYFANLQGTKRNQLEATARRVDAILAKTREYYASYGLVSRDQVDGWAQMFKHYVPLMREDHDGGMGVGQGFSIKGKEVKHRTGSSAKVVDILANIAMQREKAIVRGEKNRVAVALAGLAKLNPNPDFWSFDKPPTERVLNEKTGLVEERIDPTFRSKPNVVVAKIKDSNGQIHERAVIFNEHDERAVRMAESMKNLDATQLGGLLGVSAKITRYFSAINTQYNPIFGVTNLVRDVQAAALNLTSTPLAGKQKVVLGHVLSAAKGIYLDARAERKGAPATSKWAGLWEELQDSGGMTGYRDLYRNSEDRAKAIEHELDPHNWVNSKWGKVFTAGGMLKVPLTTAQDMASPLFDWLSDYNLMMEGSTRLAIYKTAIDHGMTKQAAASLAKNTTVNFNRKGQSGQQAGALYAFFNAAMQGTARIGENVFDMKGGDIKTLRLSKVGQKIVAGGVLLGVMQALALAAAGFDDEPPEFIRERNLIFPIGWAMGGKRYISIPMPLGFHAIPNVGRIATEYALGGFKKPADHVFRLMGVFAEAFNPMGSSGISMQTVLPTAFDPFAALEANKDWTGKTIYKEDFSSLDPTPGFTRNKDTASAWSKFMAEGINYATGGTDYTPGTFSPTADQIDYLIGQVTGGVGRETSKLAQTGQAIYTGEDLPTHKMPLVGRFYGNLENQSSQGAKYYANLKEINMIEMELKGRREDHLPTDEFRKENPKTKLIMRARYADKIIAKLRKQKRELIEKDAPREKIRSVEDRITAEMLRFNTAVDNFEARTP